ncbi:TPA: hypothetical protein NJ249_004123 [Vibrio parahaemolyticus]|nr:hypothetical protein [Vibrio parahaemolyticus]
MQYNKLRDQMFSEKTINIANSIMNKDVARDSNSESMGSNLIERYDVLEMVHEVDVSESTNNDLPASQEKRERIIGFKDFLKENKTPDWLEGWHNIACSEQYKIIMDKLEGDSLLQYEKELMVKKSNSYVFNESVVRDDMFENGRVDLKRVKTMALNAASGGSELSARLAVYNALEALHEGMRHKQSRNALVAVGAKKFMDALKQLSSIQAMCNELIRMNKRDDSKNMSVVAKIRKAKNKGDLQGLADVIAGTLAFNLSGSIKEV